MADVYSAGTMITAVMQTAGFAAQAQILDSLELFIRKFGVLIFILSCCAGLYSIMLASQYRVGLALIFGPIIFTFLIYTRSPLDGAVWRIGAGAPRGAEGTPISPTAALQGVNEVVTGKDIPQTYRVSSVFKLITHVIDTVTLSLTKALLPLKDDSREDVKNILFVAKTHALDQLLNMRMDNSLALDIVHRDLMTQCNELLDAGLVRTQPALRDYESRYHQESLQRTTSQDAATSHRRAIQQIANKRAEAEKKWALAAQKPINPSLATWKFMEASQSLPAPESATTRWMAANHPGKRVENIRDSSMTCGDLWSVAADAVFQGARGQVSELLETYGPNLSQMERGEFCVELAKKIGLQLGPGDRDTCEQYGLVQIASVLMIRNAVRNNGYSKAVERTKNEMQFYASDGTGRAIPLDTEDYDDLELVTDPMNTIPKIEVTQGVPRSLGRFRNKKTGQVESFDRPYATMTFDVAGELESGVARNQQALTRELRQQIFSYVIQLPYYMGVLLYFLSVAFPFVALASIFPGRSGVLLNFFLAWLWVKSWDVGMALVMVLDRFLWNMFPPTDFKESFWGGKSLGTISMPDVLSKGFDIDPAFNTHAYYFALSLAISFVPTVTGYMTIKLRRGVIDGLMDPITSGLHGVSGERGKIAASTYYDREMSHNTQHMKETFGAAMMSEGHQGIGLLAGQKFESANYWANQLTNARQEAAILTHSEGGAGVLKQVQTQLLGQRNNTYQKALHQALTPELNLAASKKRLFHKELSASGRFGIMANSMAAAIDGGGTYELYRYGDALTGAVSALQGVAVQKEVFGAEIDSVKMLAARGVSGDIYLANRAGAAGDKFAAHDMTGKYKESAVEAIIQWFDMMHSGKDRLGEAYNNLDEIAERKAEEEKERRLEEMKQFLRTNPHSLTSTIFNAPTDPEDWNVKTSKTSIPDILPEEGKR